MDIAFEFIITQVPNKHTADEMAYAIERVLLDKFNTAINIEWEDISSDWSMD